MFAWHVEATPLLDSMLKDQDGLLGKISKEGGIYNFKWQIELFVRLHFTNLGRSFKVKLVLGRLLTSIRVRHKKTSLESKIDPNIVDLE